MNPTTVTAPRKRRRRMMTAGVVAAGISLAGAGAAMAGDDAPDATQDEFLHMPDGYTQAQYEAFWGANYSYLDVPKLSALWGTGDTETKARAGQMILDGQTPPVAPTGPDTDLGTTNTYDAFFDAGYTLEDMHAFMTLWNVDNIETKARVGQMILDGQTPPLAPTGTPVVS